MSYARQTLLVSVLCGLVLAGCGESTLQESAKDGRSKAATSSRRIVVLGFDGLDPTLTERWMASGMLPHFSALRTQGHYQSLQSTNPPQSPVAWASFATGLNPGGHGIFDFLNRSEGSYDPEYSVARIRPPEREMRAFGYKLPLGDSSIINPRVGDTFWQRFERHGLAASVLRVPGTFPPEPITRMLSGMGVPDLIGSQGTYTLYSTQAVRGADSGQGDGRLVRVAPQPDGDIYARIDGPPSPVTDSDRPMYVDLRLRRVDNGIELRVGDAEPFVLPVGQWSEWTALSFRFPPFQRMPGMVRFYSAQGFPDVQLYMSPIHVDPVKPALPVSSPPEYASKLASRIGRYHTLGMAEETWSLNEGHLSDDAFLDMVSTIYREREQMLFDTLDANDSQLVVMVFVQPDRVSHMFWRGIDAGHPLHSTVNERGRDAIAWAYREADRILGRTMKALSPNDRLVVLSDHGFAPYRDSVHLNRWLLENGYLALKNNRNTSGALFQHVDWARTRAYAQGLNGLYLNVAGREPKGIVADHDVAALKSELIQRLTAFSSAATGGAVISRVYDALSIYTGRQTQKAPDLIVGYAPGFRASWQTALGGVPASVLERNVQKWSGDHCIDVAAVPGVLFANFKPNRPLSGIADVPGLLLDLGIGGAGAPVMRR